MQPSRIGFLAICFAAFEFRLRAAFAADLFRAAFAAIFIWSWLGIDAEKELRQARNWCSEFIFIQKAAKRNIKRKTLVNEKAVSLSPF